MGQRRGSPMRCGRIGYASSAQRPGERGLCPTSRGLAIEAQPSPSNKKGRTFRARLFQRLLHCTTKDRRMQAKTHQFPAFCGKTPRHQGPARNTLMRLINSLIARFNSLFNRNKFPVIKRRELRSDSLISLLILPARGRFRSCIEEISLLIPC